MGLKHQIFNNIKKFLKDVNTKQPTELDLYQIIYFMANEVSRKDEQVINKWWFTHIKRKNFFGERMSLGEAISEYVCMYNMYE